MVRAAQERAMERRTTLLIARWRATVLGVDRFAVFEHSRIVETYMQAELLARGGLYTRLAALQFEAG